MPEQLTYTHAVEKIKTKKEAKEYLEKLVVFCMKKGKMSREEATRLQLSNIGYFAGYYTDATRAKVERLFGAVHPFLGSVGSRKMSPEEIFEMGRKLGEENAKKKNASNRTRNKYNQ